MMGNIPVLKPAQVVGILEKLGFEEVRQRGSHRQFKHPDGRKTTVPFHKGRDLSPVLLRQIARDIGLDVKEFTSMMKRTNSFTMIEIVLAMGVIVIGVISVLGLFPVGLNASRDAIAESYACESADQFLHLIEHRIRNEGWNSWITDSSPEVPLTKPTNLGDDSPTGGGMPGSAGTMHEDSSDSGVYHVVTFRDENTNDAYDSDELADFRGVMAVWQEDISLLDDPDNSPGLTDPSNRDIGVALKLEVSWPANALYANRKKAVYHYELFNR